MYFLTLSKNANSSEVAPEVAVGGRGSGTTGVRVGDTMSASEAMVLVGCDNLFRFLVRLLALFLCVHPDSKRDLEKPPVAWFHVPCFQRREPVLWKVRLQR